MVHYEELYNLIGLNREDAGDRKKGSQMLADVNKESFEKNGTILSSLVTLKGRNQPAEGFFEFVIRLKNLDENATEDERLKVWVEEMKKVFRIYSDNFSK